jgi:hypothetical protein
MEHLPTDSALCHVELSSIRAAYMPQLLCSGHTNKQEYSVQPAVLSFCQQELGTESLTATAKRYHKRSFKKF